MFKSILFWFIAFGADSLFSNFGIKKGEMFFYFYTIIFLINILYILGNLIVKENLKIKISPMISTSNLILEIISFIVIIILTIISTKLLEIDFLTSFEVMTLAKCSFIKTHDIEKTVHS